MTLSMSKLQTVVVYEHLKELDRATYTRFGFRMDNRRGIEPGWYISIWVYDLRTDTGLRRISVKCNCGAKIAGYPTCYNLDGNPDDISTCYFCACVNDPPPRSYKLVGYDNRIFLG